jgi:hypothetical protein
MLFSKSLLNLIYIPFNMIQRKQSVFLLLVAVMMSWLLVRPFAEITLIDTRMLIFHTPAIRIYSTPHDYLYFRYTIPLVLLVFLTGVLNFVNIFLFSRRLLQIRLCIISAGLLAVIILTMLYFYFVTLHSVEHTLHSFRVAAIFPIIGIIFNFLAYRAIHQDELLVKSYDRIR